ncbi:MAG TPA: beta-ketoacyl-ACP synthase II [Polyangiaceae bacterium]|jgi:3-oxoacyl-[acyl-carrier-protein] synthase II|nr:beta-ketoacyl-ACP synthase II [Polyangiaceae bacterium]
MERVVVTGIGVISPNGIGTDATFDSLLKGESGVGPITQFETNDEYPTRFAAEVKGYDAGSFMPKKKLKEVSRFITFAMGATKMALEEAGLLGAEGIIALGEEARQRVGCFIGVGLGGLENLERVVLVLHNKGPGKVSPYFIPSIIGNLAAGQVSIEFGINGPSYCHTSACASSAHAIGEAVEWIRRGKADVMVTGGAEATITPIGIAGFSAMFALSRRNDDPTRASRPWDKDRDGFVCGEGAGTLILESLTHAKKRGANILCEVTGWSATTDAFHITKPAPEHKFAANAMRLALADANLNANQIEYINAHGTSTPSGDTEEARAIANVFGSHATDKKVWISSTKSMMGHLLGAAGAVEAAVCALVLRSGKIPPTINLDNPDPDCVLDLIPHKARERKVRHVMSNSFGFGGTNAALVLSAFDG